MIGSLVAVGGLSAVNAGAAADCVWYTVVVPIDGMMTRRFGPVKGDQYAGTRTPGALHQCDPLFELPWRSQVPMPDQGLPMLDPRSPLTLASQLAEWFRERINEGTFEDGDLLPPERELAEIFGVTRGTIRTSLETLRKEGVLASGASRTGTRVHKPKRVVWPLHLLEDGDRLDDPALGFDEFAQAMRSQELEPHEQFLGVAIEPAPVPVARAMELPRGELVVVRRRLWLANGRPMVLSTSYFPERIARSTPLMERKAVVMQGGILASIHRPQTATEDMTLARGAAPEEARALNLPPAASVLELTRTGWSGPQVVRCMVLVMRGDLNSLQTRRTHAASTSLTARLARPAESEVVLSLRTEAQEWLASRGIEQWNSPEHLDEAHEKIRARIHAGEVWMFEGPRGDIAATITLAGPDPDFWSAQERPDDALYFYTFCVARAWSGVDLGGLVLDWAGEQAEHRGKVLLRADCWRENPDLHRFYLSHGFSQLRTIYVERRKSGARFERPAQARTYAGPWSIASQHTEDEA